MPLAHRRWLPPLLDRSPARPASRSAARLSVTPLEDRTNPAPIGALDPSFGTAGLASAAGLGAGTAFLDVVQVNGSYLAAGVDAVGNFVVAKFTGSGQLDTTFGGLGGDPAGLVVDQFQGAAANVANALAVDTDDGSIYVVGSANGFFGRALLTANGTVVNSVNTGSGQGYTDVAVNSATNTVYAVGPRDGVFRVNRFDGNFTFLDFGTFPFDNAGLDASQGVALGSDGTVFAVGTADGAATLGLAVFSADLTTVVGRTYDLTGGAGIYPAFADVALSPVDGTVVLSGTEVVAGVPTVGVVRVNPTNLNDFAVGVLSGTPLDIGIGVAVDMFNRPLVAGFNAAGGLLVRFNSNLTPDTGFAPNGSLTVGPAGSVLAGVFTDATDRIVVAGLTPTGATLGRVTGGVGVPAVVFANTTGQGQSFFLNAQLNGLAQPGTPTDLIPGFAGSVRVAQADVNGDGVPDVIAGTGFGGNQVIVRDGTDLSVVLATITPFEGSFTGGVFVAAGDFNNDGRAEVVVSPDIGGGARVVVFDGATLNGVTNPAEFYSFIGLQASDGSLDTAFRNGLRVAVGDVNGDGVVDLVVAASNGGGPRVTVFDGTTIANRTAGSAASRPLANFFIFEESQRDGAFVSVGDVNGDGLADIIAGGGPNGGPRVRIVDAAQMLAAGLNFGLDPTAPAGTLNNFFAGDLNSRGGVRVMAADVDGDNLADLVTGSGDGLPGQLFVFRGTTLAGSPSGSPNPVPDQSIPLFGADPLAVGVFVG